MGPGAREYGPLLRRLREAKRGGDREDVEGVREELAEEGRRNLHFFGTVVLGYDWFTGREGIHGAMARHLEGGEGEAPRRGMKVWRGAGKSLWGSVAWPLWTLINDLDAAIMVVSARQELSMGFVQVGMDHITGNPRLRWLYPELRASKKLWRRDKGRGLVERTATGAGGTPDPSLFSGSIEKGLTGRHPTHIMYDDLTIPEDCRTRAMIRRAVQRYIEWSPLKRFEDSQQRLNCTPHAAGDLTEWIEENESWAWFVKAAEEEDGTLNWPEVFTRTRLNKERRKDLAMYSSQFLLTLVPPELQVIKQHWFRYYEAAPEGLTWYLAVDPSFGVGADESGVILGGIDRDGVVWVEEDYSGQYGEAELISLIFELVKGKGLEIVAFEGTGIWRSLEDALRAEMERRDVFFTLERLHYQTDKASRIRITVRPLYQGQRLRHKESLRGSRLEEQLLRLGPNATGGKDDRMDALAMMVQVARAKGWWDESEGVSSPQKRVPKGETLEAVSLADSLDEGGVAAEGLW